MSITDINVEQVRGRARCRNNMERCHGFLCFFAVSVYTIKHSVAKVLEVCNKKKEIYLIIKFSYLTHRVKFLVYINVCFKGCLPFSYYATR